MSPEANGQIDGGVGHSHTNGRSTELVSRDSPDKERRGALCDFRPRSAKVGSPLSVNSPETLGMARGVHEGQGTG